MSKSNELKGFYEDADEDLELDSLEDDEESLEEDDEEGGLGDLV